MKQHLATVDLVREYSDQEKRTKLRDHPNENKCGQQRLTKNIGAEGKALRPGIEGQGAESRQLDPAPCPYAL